MIAKLRSQTKEPWGWESRIGLYEDDGKTLLTIKVVLDKEQLSSEEFEKAGRFERLIRNYEDSLNEVPDKVYSGSEVTAILREKGYLTAEEKFSDTMTAKTTSAEEVGRG